MLKHAENSGWACPAHRTKNKGEINLSFKEWRYAREAVTSTGELAGRIEFIFAAPVKYEHFTLDNPARVVIDFQDRGTKPPEREIADGTIRRVRFGNPRPDILRAVIDLERMQPYRVRVEQAPFGVNISISRTRLLVLHGGSLLPIELEGYLGGVVAAEMPGMFHPQALRAQAVASRTYTARRMRALGGNGCNRAEGADICSDPGHCQAFRTWQELQGVWGNQYADLRQKVTSAVSDTRWQVLTYQGRFADAVFHSTCGGQTESAGALWGGDIPYLQSVPCTRDGHSPYHRKTFKIPLTEIAQKLRVYFGDAEPASGGTPLIVKKDTSPAGTVKALEVGGRQVSGTEFRMALALPSQHVEWQVRELEITTRGFGHRVGMCQYGADGLGQSGWGWQRIIAHYYRGVTVSHLDRDAVEYPGQIQGPLSGVKIALDPGHGGASPGARGPSGLLEKDVVLDISLMLADALKVQGANVIMSRSGDQTVTLGQRTTMANEAGADLLISIHANAHENSLANGTETYHYPESIDGRKLAEEIQKEMLAKLSRRDRGVKAGDYYVLRNAKMVAALAEIAFVSNPEEEKLLNDKNFRKQAAEAILSGIRNYLSGKRQHSEILGLDTI